jgi:hypothetical protein
MPRRRQYGEDAATATLRRPGRSWAMLEDEIAKLEARRAAAAAEGDAETAELLADAIARLRSGESSLSVQQPGRMGLGSSQERYSSEGAGSRPRRPDPMTKGHKPGGRRSC